MSEEVNLQILPPGLNGPPEDLGLRSLRRTQRILGARSLYLAMAIFLTTLVLAFLPVTHNGIIALMRWAGARGALLCFLAACVFWSLFLKKCRELKATGLPPRRGLRPREAWGFGGFLVGLVAVELFWTLTGSRQSALFLGCLAGAAAIWTGEKLHQIESADEIRFRSVTRKIFDDQGNG